MPFHPNLTTAEILNVFTEEITARGGTVTDTYRDGNCLLTRSLLPHVGEARPKDRHQGGVAMRADDAEVWLYPYLFREVCRNGAIMTRVVYAQQLESLQDRTPPEAAFALREAIGACCAEEVFTASMQRVRSATETLADHALSLLPALARLPKRVASPLYSEIVRRFLDEQDRTHYSLMNAVTSVARDTSDPELRWRLEELGGSIAAGIIPEPPQRDAAAAIARRDAVPVG